MRAASAEKSSTPVSASVFASYATMLSGTFCKLSLRFSAVTTMSCKVAEDDEEPVGWLSCAVVAAAIPSPRITAVPTSGALTFPTAWPMRIADLP